MIKKILFAAAAILFSIPSFSQFNAQLVYDYGSQMYGNDLKERPEFTVTVENVSNFNYGISSYFYIDASLSNNKMVGAYTEFSVDKRILDYPVSLHVEYNGGLFTDDKGKNGKALDDAYLVGISLFDSDLYNSFVLQISYKYLANHPIEKNSFQVTAMWNNSLLNGLFSFDGYADIWRDKSVEGDFIFVAEPQLWINFNHFLKGFNLSMGAGAECSYNFVDFKDGSKIPENRLAICPILSGKWTF